LNQLPRDHKFNVLIATRPNNGCNEGVITKGRQVFGAPCTAVVVGGVYAGPAVDCQRHRHSRVGREQDEGTDAQVHAPRRPDQRPTYRCKLLRADI